MKLQPLLAIGILAVSLLVACHRKTASTPTPPATPTPTEKPSDKPTEPKPEAYQVVGYQKTACFGKCPVYQVKFYSDGKVTWYGQLNVERKGWHETVVSKEVLKEIRDKAHAANFWDFAAAYPQGQKVADLPSTVTFIRAGDMEKIVINTHQAPVELEAFEDYLEGLINKLDWRATPGK